MKGKVCNRRRKRVSPGQFINMVKADLFAHTTSNEIRVDFNLTMSPDGSLYVRGPQVLTVYLVLERRMEPSK